MQRATASRLPTLRILLCGCAVALLPACDEAAGGGAGPGEDPGDPDRPGPGMIPGPEDPSIIEGCLIRRPGRGFAGMPLSPVSTVSVVDVEATATELDVDGVFGLARGTPASFAELATAVRFAPGGVLDARDGATYRAELALPFVANVPYPVRTVADIASHTYSVYVQDPTTGDVVRLARRYAFPVALGRVASLDAVAAIASGPRGQLSVCEVVDAGQSDVVYGREGPHAVAPLPGDQALVSDGLTTTWWLGPAGQVLGQVARGGEVAADETGNVYVALASGGQLSVHAFTPGLAPRWSRVDPVEPFADVQAIAADAGGVTLALATVYGVTSIRRYPAGGGEGIWLHGGAALAAVARDGFAVASQWEGGLAVLLYDLAGGLRWGHTFDVPATVEVMTLGQGGRVVFGGHFSGDVSFGGPTLEVAYQGEVDVNSYLVALSREGGEHVFTTRIPTTRLTGLAGNARRLVVAGETWVTPIFPHLWQLDPTGSILPGEPETGFYEQWGHSGRVAIGASDRIYWERSMVWPTPVSPAFPYLLAIEP